MYLVLEDTFWKFLTVKFSTHSLRVRRWLSTAAVRGSQCACLPEATERRAGALDRQTSPSQIPTALITLEGMTPYRRIEEAFHCKLRGPVVVDKKTLVELQNFQTVRFELENNGHVYLKYFSK